MNRFPCVPSVAALRVAVFICRCWVRGYTLGIPGPERDRRIAEIQADLWCQSRLASSTPAAVAAHIMVRMALGIPADLVWRAEFGLTWPAALRAVPTRIRQGYVGLAVIHVFFVGVILLFGLPIRLSELELHVVKGSTAAILCVLLGAWLMPRRPRIAAMVGVPGVLWIFRIVEYVAFTS